MPAYYDYRCTACGKVESRYRNARRSRCCRADLVRVDPLADLDPHRRELATFLQGKKIAGLRFDAEPGPGAFDLILSDGSELELYVISGRLTWVLMTTEEVAEQQARDAESLALARQMHEQNADLPFTFDELLDEIEQTTGKRFTGRKAQ